MKKHKVIDPKDIALRHQRDVQRQQPLMTLKQNNTMSKSCSKKQHDTGKPLEKRGGRNVHRE